MNSTFLILKISFIGLLIATLNSCNTPDKVEEPLPIPDEQEEVVQAPDDVPVNPMLNTAEQIVVLLRDKNYTELSQYISAQGVRFSPYSFIDTVADVLATREDLLNDEWHNTTRMWGNYDGSGDPIEATFDDYSAEFIYDVDFSDAHKVNIDTTMGIGNTLDNLEEIYPNKSYVEFYFSGFDPQYDGMDWRSLRLVFEAIEGNYFLVAIVHGEWTI